VMRTEGRYSSPNHCVFGQGLVRFEQEQQLGRKGVCFKYVKAVCLRFVASYCQLCVQPLCYGRRCPVALKLKL
jgi:hypothetical protein